MTPVQTHHAPQHTSAAGDVTRDELRQLIMEELRSMKGDVG
jgi:DNA-binding transcriptional regulator YdaS (Cro superfamily)